MLELLNAFGYMGANSFVSSLYGFIRKKILAAYLGPFGVGIFFQANLFQMMIRQITTLGLNSGLVKLIAEYHSQGDFNKLNRLIGTVFLIFTGFGIVLIPISFILGEPIAERVFGDPEYFLFVPIVVASGFFFVQYSIILNIFRGFLQWKKFVRISTLGYGISVFFTAGLIIWGGVLGSVVSILVTHIGNFLIALYYFNSQIRKTYEIRLLRDRPDFKSFRELVRLVGPLAFTTILTSVTIIFIGSEITQQLGVEANGIYDVVWGISLSYMTFITQTAGSYGIPKASTLSKDDIEMGKIQNNSIKLFILFITPISVLLLALNKIWIPILYSSEFMAAQSLLVYQFLGDLCYGVRVGMDLDLLPRARIHFLVFEMVLKNIIWAGLTVVFLPIIGILIVPVGYFISLLLLLIVSYIYHKGKTQFVFARRNWIMLGKSLILIGTTNFLISNYPNLNIFIFLIVGLVVGLWLPGKDDWKKIGELVKNRIGPRN